MIFLVKVPALKELLSRSVPSSLAVSRKAAFQSLPDRTPEAPTRAVIGQVREFEAGADGSIGAAQVKA
jgi:hypothetical protein